MRFWRKRKQDPDQTPTQEARSLWQRSSVLANANPALYAELVRGEERRPQQDREMAELKRMVAEREAEHRKALAVGRRLQREAVAEAEHGPLHAYEVTQNDAALIRAMARACFADDAIMTLPSGRTVTGAEMRRWGA